MAKQYGSRRKRRGRSTPLVTVGLLMVGLVGGALLLHVTGVYSLPFLTKKAEAPKGPDLRGMVLVPRAARSITAYSEVTQLHLLDPQTKRLAIVPFTPAQAEDAATLGLLLDANAIKGRVLRRDKPAGMVFTESDFYPKGTRPGPTAGVPPGKRAMRLKANQVPGLHGLQQGDRFDMVMTEAVEIEQQPLRQGPSAGSGLDVEGPYAGLHEAENSLQAATRQRIKRKHAVVRTIVNNGLVVQPVTARKEIGTATSLLRGSKLTATPVEEIIIAVDPQEVAALNLALGIGAKLQVAMRSGQICDGEIEDVRIPDLEVVLDQEETTAENGTRTVGRTKVIEVIAGGEKQLLAVPDDKDSETRE